MANFMYSLLFSTLAVESISSISMSKLLSVWRKIRAFVAGFLAVLAIVAVIVPATANPNPWQWQDQSALLPVRDGVSLSIVSEREGVWLLSDGSRLYRYDGTTVTDLTKSIRDREIYSITKIFSDGRNWLVYTRPQYHPDAIIWLTDGYSWTNVTKSLPATRGDEATGMNGEWFIQTIAKGGHPATGPVLEWHDQSGDACIRPNRSR